MLKDFKTLSELDISQYVSQRAANKERTKMLDYISWADMLILLYEQGAKKVRYGNLYNEQGHSVFLSPVNNAPEVHVYVDIDEDRYELSYPVIQGVIDISMENLTQSRIHKATQRAFVKCVSINTGLGIKLWQKEEEENNRPEDTSMSGNLKRVKEKYSRAVKKLGTVESVNKALGLTRKQAENMFAYVDRCAKSEKILEGLL